MQPLQCDFRLSAAEGNSILHAAATARSLYAAIPLRSAETELQNTIRIATHDLKTTRCHAAVPVHKAPQHMQTSKAQRQQRKVSWKLQF